jgi:glycyl-tRNA synthetase
MQNNLDLFDKIVALSKRRGFIYPGSEIYGGLANTYDYGPMGVELLRNIKNAWWDNFVTRRDDMYGLDSCILMNPKVWEASGHTESFADTLVDCKNCHLRTRADHLIEDYYEETKKEEIKVDGLSLGELNDIITNEHIKCPNCKKFDWTETRKFNQLFETKIGIVEDAKALVYLRGEIAQGMFVNFKNVLDSFSPKLPFGIAQTGAAFRNEITMGKLIFRMLQFNLSEFEYFFDPDTKDWNELYEYFRQEMWNWTVNVMGLSEEKLRWRPHTDEERAHYSKKTEDIEYEFPWGFKELYGLAYRTDFDLRNHTEKSGIDLSYRDPYTGKKFIPHVIEPTFGMDRTVLTILMDSYREEEKDGKSRIYLKIKPSLAPVKAAVFPLLSNKEELVSKAREVYQMLKQEMAISWDDRGNIGKRYAAQDEIGTPYCITVDFDTINDGMVTVRDRDTASQQRVKISELKEFLNSKIHA